MHTKCAHLHVENYHTNMRHHKTINLCSNTCSQHLLLLLFSWLTDCAGMFWTEVHKCLKLVLSNGMQGTKKVWSASKTTGKLPSVLLIYDLSKHSLDEFMVSIASFKVLLNTRWHLFCKLLPPLQTKKKIKVHFDVDFSCNWQVSMAYACNVPRFISQIDRSLVSSGLSEMVKAKMLRLRLHNKTSQG